jgi:NhaP-type Na+/H+ or K+/H+ antiporter
LVLTEHAGLLWLGLLIGIVSAAIAVLPELLSPRAELPVLTLTVTLGGVLFSGMLWTWLATRFALRGKLLAALRNE